MTSTLYYLLRRLAMLHLGGEWEIDRPLEAVGFVVHLRVSLCHSHVSCEREALLFPSGSEFNYLGSSPKAESAARLSRLSSPFNITLSLAIDLATSHPFT